MPTLFSQFFEPGNGADEFHTRILTAIGGATNIAECYIKLYEYMVSSIGWWSRKFRNEFLDKTVDVSMIDDAKVKDAETYFGDFLDPENAVLFEYLKVVPQSKFGPCVYSLEFDSTNLAAARRAYRQVQLYLRVKNYNDAFDDQDSHHQANPDTTAALPNAKITINPANPVNPDDATQLSTLKKGVDDLVAWIGKNYPEYKVLLDTNTGELFKLVFENTDFTYEDTIAALAAMLDKICAPKRKNARETRNSFGKWVIARLADKEAFWSNTLVDAYSPITELKTAYLKKPSEFDKMFEAFNKLFAAFLESDPYAGETAEQAEDRCEEALLNIKAIFETFVDPQGVEFSAMMNKAHEKIEIDQGSYYTNDIRRAYKEIPAENSVKTKLPEILREKLKIKADEIFQELPLKLDGVEVKFFVIPNYNDLKAMSQNSVQILRGMEEISRVRVNVDPFEGPNGIDRPIYREIQSDADNEYYIAFCNLELAVPGTFYYTTALTPALMTFDAQYSWGNIATTIDFQNYTIEYSGKIDKNQNEAGQFYRELGSTKNFYAELRTISKWKTIEAVRRYDPYYTTTSAGVKNSVPHLAGFVAAGRGVSRTWPLHDDSLCLWYWDVEEPALSQFSRLGEVLGLPLARQIRTVTKTDVSKLKLPNKTCTVNVGDTQFDFKNYGPRYFAAKGFYYRVIGITEMGEDEQFYVQVNTPTSGVAATLTGHKGLGRRASRKMENDPAAILNLFQFSYFRRITIAENKETGEQFSSDSKVIQLFKSNDTRKPTGPAIGKATSTKDGFSAVGLNLPICFNVSENIIKYYDDKETRGKIINKGNVLYRAEATRLDASTAMKEIYRLIRSPMSAKLSASRIPATAFANAAMRQSESQRLDWGRLKGASSDYLPILQEWCHLRGHGDGGDEYPGNFVSGSIHCNTEQLAIETGQRLVTQQMPKKSFYLYTTAYMLRDATNYKSPVDAERQSEILRGNYLQDSPTYKAMLEVHTANHATVTSISDGPVNKRARTETGIQKRSPEHGDVAPVAAYIRYKVMRSDDVVGGSGDKRARDKVDDTRKKFFDFIFEGQSEFIDVHQFNLICQSVQFALAGDAAFKNWYQLQTAQLDQKASTT